MNKEIKVKVPLNSKFLTDFNNLSESQRNELVEAMIEMASKDVIESQNLGFVTFADILGWKGIWKQHYRQPLKEIIRIKESLSDEKNRLYYDYLCDLSKEIFNYDPRKTFDIKSKKISEIENLNKEMQDHIYSVLRPFLNPNLNNGQKISLEKPPQEKVEKLRKKIRTFEEKDIFSLDIELISDTFVITSYGSDEIVLKFHMELLKKLISKCLDYNLLIRGATSYGEFNKEQMVFVGPAIDEAASWHEQGDEVGIFLTPSAYLNYSDFKAEGIIEDREALLKNGKFMTKCVNWREGKEKFEEICKKESPITPDIAKKYLNSMNYLNSEIKS